MIREDERRLFARAAGRSARFFARATGRYARFFARATGRYATSLLVGVAALGCTIGELQQGANLEEISEKDSETSDATSGPETALLLDAAPVSLDADDAPQKFCAAYPIAALCEDFEGGSVAKFPGREIAPLTNTVSVIPGATSAYVLRVLSDTSLEGAYTRILAPIADSTSKFRYGCDVSFVGFDDASLNEVCSAWLTIPGKGLHVITAGRDTGGGLLIRDGYFPEGGGFNPINQPSGFVVPPNTWTRIEVTVDFAAVLPTIQMKVNGGNLTNIDVPVDSAGVGALVLKPTLNWVTAPQVPIEVLFDNILVEFL